MGWQEFLGGGKGIGLAGLTNCALETFFIPLFSGQKPRWKFLISGHWIDFPFGQGEGEGKRTESRRSGKAGKTCRRRHSPISRTSPESPQRNSGLRDPIHQEGLGFQGRGPSGWNPVRCPLKETKAEFKQTPASSAIVISSEPLVSTARGSFQFASFPNIE